MNALLCIFHIRHWIGIPQMHCSGFAASDSLMEAFEKALLEIVSSARSVHYRTEGRRLPLCRTESDARGFLKEFQWLERLRSIEASYHAKKEPKFIRTREALVQSHKKYLGAALRRHSYVSASYRRGLPAVRVLTPELDDCM